MQPYTEGPIDTYEGHINGSTLDYIGVPAEICHLFTRCFVHEWSSLNTSDHVPISATIDVSGITYVEGNIESVGQIKWGKLSATDKFRKYQCVLEPYISVINAEFNTSRKSYDDIDHAFTELTRVVQDVAKTLPHSRYKRNLKPFWNRELSSLKLKKVNSYRKWVCAGRPRDSGDDLYVEYKFDKKKFQTTLKKFSKEYENKEILEAVRVAEVNRNYFWKLVNTACKNQIRGVAAIKRPDSTVVHEIKEVLDVWADHFDRIGYVLIVHMTRITMREWQTSSGSVMSSVRAIDFLNYLSLHAKFWRP